MYAITIDQRKSRQGGDGVPDLLRELEAHSVVRKFERTAGDEVQGLCADPEVVVDIAISVARTRMWWIGIGIGAVEEPLAASVRANRGPAFLAARKAVERAKGTPAGLAVEGQGGRHAETALTLLARIVVGRTPEGESAIDAMKSGATQAEAARTLGISQQAVSQRLQAARWIEECRARELAAYLLEDSPDAQQPG